jgi:hypothetical protein
MQYLISGKLLRPEAVINMPHEEFVQLIKSMMVPTLKALLADNTHGRVLGGGFRAGSRDLVMVVDLRGQDSHRCVHEFLVSLPAFPYFQWEAAPLVTFAEAVQGW